MFEDARDDLIDVLSANEEPISATDAKAQCDANDIMVESVINRYATVEQIDSTDTIVAIEGGPSFEEEVEESDSETPSDAESDDVSDSDSEESNATEATPESTQETTAARTIDSDAGTDPDNLFEVNGIRITCDPARELVGEPTGDDWNGLPVLTNGHDKVPNQTTPYFPVEVSPGNRDSEEWAGRVLGTMCKPLLWEGESGTGKNQNIDHALNETNRIKQRTNFGSDVSVFDMVGEKDFDDEGSYYILGDIAKAAMFGHTSIWDEVNMVTGDISSFLHGLAEEPGSRSLELRGTGVTLTDIPVDPEEIEDHGSWYLAAREKWTAEEHLGQYIHPEFRVAATCNPVDYAGTKQMNDAFRDRFTVVEHPYLDPDMEAALLAEETEANADDVKPLTRLAKSLRESREHNNIPGCPITHRALLQTVEVAGPAEEWMTFKEAALNVMVETASEPQDKDYIKDAISDEL